jgi:hypothetical protein
MKDSLRAACQPPRTLRPGTHPASGFNQAPKQEGVYRALLKPCKNKTSPDHSNYAGFIQLANCVAGIRLWLHDDGTLGLRVQKLKKQPKQWSPSRKGAQK